MMSCTVFDDTGVALLELADQVGQADLEEAAGVINGYLDGHSQIDGLVVHAEFFPWWADFANQVQHLKLNRSHEQQIDRVAICSDSEMADLLPKIGAHFTGAEVRAYKGEEVSEAMHWVHGDEE